MGRPALREIDHHLGGRMRVRTSADGQYNWASDLREREVAAAEEAALAAAGAVDAQRRTVRMQAIALAFAAAATLAATYAAYQAGNAVKASQNIASQQEIESQLSTAVTAVGQKAPADQVAGLTLLRSSVQSEVDEAVEDPSIRINAYNAYVTSLEMIHAYLRSTTSPGHTPPIAAVYAADELRDILALGPEVTRIHNGSPPSLDLSVVGLSGISWTGIRFDSLTTAYMPWIDLRGVDLANTRWGHATLIHAHLQCADLQGADLREANLNGADLRGADLAGAELPPTAMLKDVQTTGAVGPVHGLKIRKPSASYQLAKCFTTKAYASVPAPPRF
jgi:hypothetical protein